MTVSGPLRSNIGDALLTAAIDGLGVIYEPTFLVHEALHDGRLVRVLPDWTPDEFGIYAVYTNRRFMPPKLRRYIDFLAERFGPSPYWDAPLAEAAPNAAPKATRSRGRASGRTGGAARGSR